jgi:hypothetical protein
MEDFIAWRFDTKGSFSVRSAYKVYIDNEQECYGWSSGCIVHHPAIGMAFPWHKIWEIHCSNKVKTFAWRLSHNSLPMKRRIEWRGIELDTNCPMCFRFDEDVGHLLLKCKYARNVMQQMQIEEMWVKLSNLVMGPVVWKERHTLTLESVLHRPIKCVFESRGTPLGSKNSVPGRMTSRELAHGSLITSVGYPSSWWKLFSPRKTARFLLSIADAKMKEVSR